MSNSYFQFKQFKIDQDQCGMKVTTDACLFGALPPNRHPKRILDIGAGTGLLALMKTQQCNARIDAIEIESSAAQQAYSNFKNSPWNSRLTIHHVRLQDFNSENNFDLIISNPPFFRTNQVGNDATKNTAIHNTTLSFEDLAQHVKRLLTPDLGVFSVLYPEHEMMVFSEIMTDQGFHVSRDIKIFNKIDSPVFRRIRNFSFQPCDHKEEEIIIRNAENAYTDDFITLLKPYYLHL